MNNYSGNEFIGDNFKPYRNVKDTAKLIRKDIKRHFPGIKASVRIDRYSGGQSVRIEIKSVSFAMINQDWLVSEIMGECTYDVARYTDEACKLLDDLRSLGMSYNRNDSDSMVDYFDVDFYLHVDFNWKAKNSWIISALTAMGIDSVESGNLAHLYR